MLRLATATGPAWVACVLDDFDAFLLDHAACERKASSSALVMVAHFRHHQELVAQMIDLAREELEHFHACYQHIAARGLTLAADRPDPYVGGLVRLTRPGHVYLLDRLLVSAVIEARACERLTLVAEALDARNDPLAGFYQDLVRAEARHHGIYVRLAQRYFDEAAVAHRLSEVLAAEAQVLADLPLRPAVH